MTVFLERLVDNDIMKRFGKEKVSFILLTAAFVATVVCAVLYYTWLQHDNAQLHTASLSDAERSGSAYEFILEDFTAELGPRGGDSGAWLKEPILDDEGNQLHGASVGTIYELKLTNTSGATITDWTMQLYMPEQVWLNNAWNGTMEVHQTTTGELLVQELNLKEYNSKPITIDYYIDHTGPMIPLAAGDSFVYLPSKADNEMPLDPQSDNEETKSTALIGFILYVPDQTLDYIVAFEDAVFSYRLERNAWTSPIFIILTALLAVWIILLIAMTIAHIRVRTLLRQQKHDAQIIEQSINTFINFIEAKDPSTKGHSERVAKIAYALAVEMGYSPRECNRIYYIALMHDCGKISIPANILRKPGRLTEDEYEIIKSHTTYGEKMLRDFTSIDGISLGVLYHHERYDGGGYPKGLSGNDIPVIARIICVADALDAMNSNRCYRPPMTKEQILSELENNKGKQFDPEVVEKVLHLIKQGVILIGE